MRKPPNTTIRYNQLWARMYIPEDVRPDFDGQKLWLAKLGPWPMSISRATALAAVQVAEWKCQIERARGQGDRLEPILQAKQEIAHAALEAMDEEQLRSVAHRLLARLNPAANHNLLDLVEDDELRSTTHHLLANVRSEQPAVASPDDAAFLAHFDDWKMRTNLKGKTLDQAKSDIKQFADAVKETLATLSGKHVQAWIENLLETISANTVRRKLSALKSYWGWLQAHEHVSADRKPFDGRKIQDRRTKVEKALDKRQRFEPAEVVKLIAKSADDGPLQALIRLGAFTGARREGLASLKTDSVVMVEGIRSLRLQEKTEAGVRDVPIHPEIAGLVNQLIKYSKDGFLIPSETNKYGKRGDALGKRFTRLKTSMGFGDHHTFHSIRHTVVHLFRKAECPLEIRNQILGHEDGDAGAGAGYGGHVEQKQKLDWIKKAVTYPQVSAES